MADYEMIAFDMDGTLLNTAKELTQGVISALKAASERGKTVILNTGRNPAELKDYLEQLPMVRYVNCESGAIIYDAYENRIVSSQAMEADIVLKLFEIGKSEDAMLHLASSDSTIEESYLKRMSHYRMEQYRPLFEKVTTKVPDLEEYYRKSPFPVGKFNMYHTDEEARTRTVSRIRDEGLPVEMAEAEETSLEVSPAGLHKGVGLKMLSDFLDIPMEKIIVVGDAGNDLMAMKAGGFALAMANSKPEILAIADAVVADNDHDGCAEAVYRYLLGEVNN